jgi:putative monooxygenase
VISPPKLWSALALAAGGAVAGSGCGSASTLNPAPPTAVQAAAPADAGPEAADDREAEQIAAIEYAVNSVGPAVHTCYKAATAETLQVSGRVMLQVEFVNDTGKGRLSVAVDETGSSFLTDCLLRLYQGFQWPRVFAAGDRVDLPLSFVAADAQYTVSRQHVSPRVVSPGFTATVLLDAANSGNAVAALTWLQLQAGAEAPLHSHPSAELVYVVDGAATVFGAAGKRTGTAVSAGSAIYIPAGVPHGFSVSSDVSAVQLYTPGGPEQRFKGDDNPSLAAPVSPRQAQARRRGAQPRVATVAATPAQPIAAGNGSVVILFDAESAADRAAYVGVLTAQPGLSVPEHVHDASTELLYVLQGAGVMTVDGAEHPVAADMAIQVPAGRRHGFQVTSAEPIIAIQFYTPSGPEQRFKQ